MIDSKEEEQDDMQPFPASLLANRTGNKVRAVVENLEMPVATGDKKLIPLSIGDPTVYGNLNTPEVVVDAICAHVKSYKCHGYVHSSGMESARAAVAEKYSYPHALLTANDVIMTSGCSVALSTAIKALASEGDNILVPSPGFALYGDIMESNGIVPSPYRLIAENKWEADILAIEAGINERTRAILVNNPSNPCGSVSSKAHLLEIIAVAEKYNLVILADEIYGDIVFKGNQFFPIASLTATVPVITVSGISKEFVVPGFRVGWMVCYNNRGLLSEVWNGATAISRLILGPNTIVQAALREIILPEGDAKKSVEMFKDGLISHLEASASLVSKCLGQVDGLRVIQPQGAMYCMVQIDVAKFDSQVVDDVSFVQLLVKEELVFVLPGSCFGAKNFVRVVLCPPLNVMTDACSRIAAFCSSHKVKW